MLLPIRLPFVMWRLKPALDAAEIQHLELQLQRKAFEQELMRGHMETAHKQRTDLETRRLQEELEERKRRLAQGAERDDARMIRQVRCETSSNVNTAMCNLWLNFTEQCVFT